VLAELAYLGATGREAAVTGSAVELDRAAAVHSY
jgi:hypothetical protein